MADKAWFKIRRQDMFMDSFYNPNNRTVQYYLNLIKMYRFSLFANAMLFVTSAPTVKATAVKFAGGATGSVAETKTLVDTVITTPFQANDTITVASSASGKATASISGKTVTITGVDAGSANITVTAGEGVTATKAVTVTE